MAIPTLTRARLARFLLACAALAPGAALAQTLPEATLSAQASAEVTQDEAQITMAAEVAGSAQEQVSQALNTRLQAAMQQAKGHPGIDVQNGAYRLWPSNDRDGKLSEWHGRAEILLQSHDFKAVSKLAAALAPHMQVSGISFSVSDAVRTAQEQKLLTQAVAAFEQRAHALALALGFGGYRLKTISLDGAGGHLVSPAPRVMAMAAAAPDVALEAGRERITLSVRGVIFLLPRQTATDR